MLITISSKVTAITILLDLSVRVPVYKSKDSARNYSKADFCYYCDRKLDSKISKHYLRTHTDRDLVKQIIMTEPGSGLKKKLLYKLQQLGNYKHNRQVYLSIIIIIILIIRLIIIVRIYSKNNNKIITTDNKKMCDLIWCLYPASMCSG